MSNALYRSASKPLRTDSINLQVICKFGDLFYKKELLKINAINQEYQIYPPNRYITISFIELNALKK